MKNSPTSKSRMDLDWHKPPEQHLRRPTSSPRGQAPKIDADKIPMNSCRPSRRQQRSTHHLSSVKIDSNQNTIHPSYSSQTMEQKSNQIARGGRGHGLAIADVADSPPGPPASTPLRWGDKNEADWPECRNGPCNRFRDYR